MMKTNLAFAMRKRQFLGILLFGLSLFIFKSFTYFYDKIETIQPIKINFENANSGALLLTDFDPNNLDANQWKQLGFTERQVATILKYKTIVGGNFTSKAQLKKCYAISEDKYHELSDHILLPETTSKTESPDFYTKKTISISKKFNPDNYSEKDWISLGFSEKQSAAILKYKQYLGGSFVSKEKFKDCFIINDENYEKLSPYLILPEKTPENFKSFANNSSKKNNQYKNFDPNILDVLGWSQLGFSEKQAQVIVNYRDKNLKGSFKTLEDIKSCFVISEEKFNALKKYIILNPETMKTTVDSKNTAYTKVNNQQSDFSTLDLNKISFKQLIEFGFDEKAAGSFIGFRKKLGGFINTQQILDTYNIDKDLTQKLINTCKFSTDDVQKYSLVDAPEEWLKNHPYFKYSADKIIFYRISNPDDKKIWKFLKLKPEYETKMRWYIK